MIDFNKLLITPDHQNLLIDVSIENLSYYTNMYIDKIVIDTQDTYDCNGVSNAPIYTFQASGNTKEIQLVLTNNDISVPILNNLFFVYVITTGETSSDTPWGMDSKIALGTVIDAYDIYKEGLSYMMQLHENPNNKKAFIDFILRLKSFEIAMKTHNYQVAINYWNKFFNKEITL